MIRLRSTLAACAAVAAVAASQPAFAADPAPNPKSAELARRLFADMQMDRMMQQMITQMGPTMVDQMRKSNPNITDAQAKAVSETMAETMQGLMPKLVDKMIPLYASTFTENELRELVTFYEGPTGKAMLAKMPQLTAKIGPIMSEIMPDLMADMQKRLCAKIDCKTGAARSSD